MAEIHPMQRSLLRTQVVKWGIWFSLLGSHLDLFALFCSVIYVIEVLLEIWLKSKIKIEQKLFVRNEKTRSQRQGVTEMRPVYHTVSLKQIHYPPVLEFKLAFASQDSTVSSCKTARLCNSGELNYVNSITFNLELRLSKKEWERKKKKEAWSKSSLVS